MGCLTAAIYTAFLYDIDSSIENKNVELNTTVNSLNAECIVELVNVNFIDALISRECSDVHLELIYSPPTIHTAISLVCNVSSGEYEFLRVIEGNIITIDGQYIRVLRNGV